MSYITHHCEYDCVNPNTQESKLDNNPPEVKWSFVKGYLLKYFSKLDSDDKKLMDSYKDFPMPKDKTDVDILHDFFQKGHSLYCRNEDEAKRDLAAIDLLVGTIDYDHVLTLIVLTTAPIYSFRLCLTSLINSYFGIFFLSLCKNKHKSLYPNDTSYPEGTSEFFPPVVKYQKRDDNIVHDIIYLKGYTTLKEGHNLGDPNTTGFYNELMKEALIIEGCPYLPLAVSLRDNITEIEQFKKLNKNFTDNMIKRKNFLTEISYVKAYKQKARIIYDIITKHINHNTTDLVDIFSNYVDEEEIDQKSKTVLNQAQNLMIDSMEDMIYNPKSYLDNQMNMIWDPEEVKIFGELLLKLDKTETYLFFSRIPRCLNILRRHHSGIPKDQYVKLITNFINLALRPLIYRREFNTRDLYKTKLIESLYEARLEELLLQDTKPSDKIILDIARCTGDNIYEEIIKLAEKNLGKNTVQYRHFVTGDSSGQNY